MGKYEHYLESEHWKEVKSECKQIGLFNKCIICGENKKINIHHLNYNCLFNEDILKDLVPLCRRCHLYVHDRMKEHNVKEMTMGEFKKRFLYWEKPRIKKTKEQKRKESKIARKKWIMKKNAARKLRRMDKWEEKIDDELKYQIMKE